MSNKRLKWKSGPDRVNEREREIEKERKKESNTKRKREKLSEKEFSRDFAATRKTL